MALSFVGRNFRWLRPSSHYPLFLISLGVSGLLLTFRVSLQPVGLWDCVDLWHCDSLALLT